MKKLLAIIQGEPVLVYNLVATLIALVVAFGLSLPVGGAAALLAVVQAILALVARGKVSPVSNDPAEPAQLPF